MCITDYLIFRLNRLNYSQCIEIFVRSFPELLGILSLFFSAWVFFLLFKNNTRVLSLRGPVERFTAPQITNITE